MKRKTSSMLQTLVLGIGTTLACVAPAAQTSSWISDTDLASWMLPEHWDPAFVPNEPGATALLTNNITGARTIVLDLPVTIGTLQVGSQDGIANFNVSGPEALTFDNAGSAARLNSPTGNNQDVISANMVLSGNLIADTAKDLTLEGVISESAPGAAIIKEGPGTLTITNGNSYSGGLFINGGAVKIKTEMALGADPGVATPGNITISNNATLWLDTSNVLKRNRGIYIAPEGATINSTALSGIYGVLEGPGMLTKIGANTLFLATNFYQGGTWLKEGNLKLGSASPTWSQLGPGDLTMEDNTGLFAWGTTARTLTNRIIIKGDIRLGSTGASDRAILTLSGPIDFGDTTRTLEGRYTNSITGIISGAPGVGLVKTGPGEIRLSGNQDYTGPTVVKEGRLSVNNKGSSIDSFGANPTSVTLSNLVMDGGEIWVQDYATTLRNRGIWITENGGKFGGRSIATSSPIEGPGGLTIDMGTTTIRVTLSGPGTYEGGTHLVKGKLRLGFISSVIGTGPLTIESGTYFVGWTPLTLTNSVIINGDFTLGGTASGETAELTLAGPVSLGSVSRSIYCIGAQTINGVISGDPGVGLTKLETGILTLSGPNTYNGPTTVADGSLVVSTVHAGGGDFTINGGLTFGVERDAAAPTLSIPNLSMGDGAMLSVFLPAGPSNIPLLQVNNLILNSSAFIKLYGGSYAPGTYPLIKYTAMSGYFEPTPLRLPSGVNALIVNNAATSTIELVVSSSAPSILYWSGLVSSAWNFSALNWVDASGETAFGQGDAVIFDDSYGTTTNILKTGVLQPASVSISSSLNYSFGGPGTLSGSMSLTKQGPGLLALLTPNTYTGPTFVNEGVLRVSNSEGSATGTGPVNVAGTLEGSGIIASSVNLLQGGTLSPGVAGLGTLTAGSISMAADSTNYIEISKNAAASDTVVANTIQYGGTLVVANRTGELTGGESFQLYSAPVLNGNFAQTVLPALTEGLTWNWNPTTGVLSVDGGVSNDPTTIGYVFANGKLTLSWPETHKGWHVQSNAVDVADSAAWYNVEGSDAASSLEITIDPSATKVFYRLFKP